MGLRVVGCLIEKQRTTPDAYPLSLNALRAACNQSTNRDPVVVVRRADDPRRARPALAPRLGAARERPGQPRGQVPAPARRGARPRRRRAGAARGADAARPADAGRAQPAQPSGSTRSARSPRSRRRSRRWPSASWSRASRGGPGRRRTATRTCSARTSQPGRRGRAGRPPSPAPPAARRTTRWPSSSASSAAPRRGGRAARLAARAARAGSSVALGDALFGIPRVRRRAVRRAGLLDRLPRPARSAPSRRRRSDAPARPRSARRRGRLIRGRPSLNLPGPERPLAADDAHRHDRRARSRARAARRRAATAGGGRGGTCPAGRCRAPRPRRAARAPRPTAPRSPRPRATGNVPKPSISAAHDRIAPELGLRHVADRPGRREAEQPRVDHRLVVRDEDRRARRRDALAAAELDAVEAPEPRAEADPVEEDVERRPLHPRGMYVRARGYQPVVPGAPLNGPTMRRWADRAKLPVVEPIVAMPGCGKRARRGGGLLGPLRGERKERSVRKNHLFALASPSCSPSSQ